MLKTELLDSENKTLASNVDYRVSSFIGSFYETAKIEIPSLYPGEFSFIIGDELSLTETRDDYDSVLIFHGFVTEVFDKSDCQLLILNSFSDADEEVEYTFKNTDYKTVFTKIFGGTINFSAENLILKRFFHKGTKESALSALLKTYKNTGNTIICYSEDNELYLLSEFEERDGYILDDFVLSGAENAFIMLPLPELRIGDLVQIYDIDYRILGIINKGAEMEVRVAESI